MVFRLLIRLSNIILIPKNLRFCLACSFFFTLPYQVLPSKLEIARENHVAYCALDKYIIVCAGWNGRFQTSYLFMLNCSNFRESLASIEVFEILDDHPFLHKLPCSFNLISPRNRPSLVEEQLLLISLFRNTISFYLPFLNLLLCIVSLYISQLAQYREN